MNKTYQNTQIGFEIDVPENWLLPTGAAVKSPFGEAVIFSCGANENFNIEIGRSLLESLDKVEQEFRRYALGRQYAGLEFGMIEVGHKNHVWARYQPGRSDWAKKYLLIFESIEYDITATCFDLKVFAEREAIWDKVVESFRPMTPAKPKAASHILDRMNEASQLFNIGYSHFRSGEYQKALEQFERGKLVTHEFPWNFFGTSMTLMQMIETGRISNEQIDLALRNAEKNLEICLLLSPGEPDYVAAMNAIQEFKKKRSSQDANTA